MKVGATTSRRRSRPLDQSERNNFCSESSSNRIVFDVELLVDEGEYCLQWPQAPLARFLQRKKVEKSTTTKAEDKKATSKDDIIYIPPVFSDERRDTPYTAWCLQHSVETKLKTVSGSILGSAHETSKAGPPNDEAYARRDRELVVPPIPRLAMLTSPAIPSFNLLHSHTFPNRFIFSAAQREYLSVCKGFPKASIKETLNYLHRSIAKQGSFGNPNEGKAKGIAIDVDEEDEPIPLSLDVEEVPPREHVEEACWAEGCLWMTYFELCAKNEVQQKPILILQLMGLKAVVSAAVVEQEWTRVRSTVMWLGSLALADVMVLYEAWIAWRDKTSSPDRPWGRELLPSLYHSLPKDEFLLSTEAAAAAAASSSVSASQQHQGSASSWTARRLQASFGLHLKRQRVENTAASLFGFLPIDITSSQQWKSQQALWGAFLLGKRPIGLREVEVLVERLPNFTSIVAQAESFTRHHHNHQSQRGTTDQRNMKDGCFRYSLPDMEQEIKNSWKMMQTFDESK